MKQTSIEVVGDVELADLDPSCLVARSSLQPKLWSLWRMLNAELLKIRVDDLYL